jgi:ATP-dependent Lon protease
MESRTLPLLIQPAVLFPGATLPLRLESARHRKLIKDVAAGDRMVGVIALPIPFTGDEPTPKVGFVGCLAKVVSAKKIPNKQIRIVVQGLERFSIQSFVTSDEPYQQANVAPYGDFEESAVLLGSFADEVRQYYARYMVAAGKIADKTKEKVVELPADPIQLSLALPGMLRLDEETCQRFLASRSPLMRLRELAATLAPAVSTAEAGAELHTRSRTNGHGARHN